MILALKVMASVSLVAFVIGLFIQGFAFLSDEYSDDYEFFGAAVQNGAVCVGIPTATIWILYMLWEV